MNLIEKLKIIAQNEQKVYDAGCEKGLNDWVDMRTNNKTNFGYFYCAASYMVTAPALDTSKGTNFVYMFNACSQLVTIPILNVSRADLASSNSLSNVFNFCSKLENITFEGVIPKSISFRDCSKLTKASLDNIIDSLKDVSSGTTQTLTLHADVKAKLTDSDIVKITQKGWIVE